MSTVDYEKKRREYNSSPTAIMKLRIKLGLTQGKVADDLKMTRIHFGNIEKGIHAPKVPLVELIANYFECPVSKIFKKVDEKHYMVKR